MAAPISRSYYSISELLQRRSLLPYSFSAFPPPPLLHHHVIHPLLSTIEIEIIEGNEEVGKNRMVGKKKCAQQNNDQTR